MVLPELELEPVERVAYEANQQAFLQKVVYTLDPEKFGLPDMVVHPRPFRADVYRKRFERGGTRIAAALTAYVLLGNAHEQFLVHRIGGRPDYDQVLRGTLPAATAR